MVKTKKLTLYELNPRFFKDDSNDGIGDLQGLISKFDYFKYLGVDGIILQDILSADSNDKIQNFQTISSDIGTLKEFENVISISKRNKTKVLIELNIGTIKETHKWFEKAIIESTKEFNNIIEKKEDKNTDINENSNINNIEYKFSKERNSYYLVDTKTQEIILNWKSEQVMERYLEVIQFWVNLGVSGFVFKNFEYLYEVDKKNQMSIEALKELGRFYRSIKNINNEIIIVGKVNSNISKNIFSYTNGLTQFLDYLLPTEISMLGTKNDDIDEIGKFKQRKLVKNLKMFGNQASNVIAFGTSKVGRVISRWANDNQYHNESSKILSILLKLSKASSTFYYGDEIGAINIGLSTLDDFQDKTLSYRKLEKVNNKFTEEKFLKAQVLQNPINARSLMAWNTDINGGFSTFKQTITPVSKSFKYINVETEFSDKNSILNFNRLLIKIISNPNITQIINRGKYKIKISFFGVILIFIKYKNEKIKALINLSENNKIIFGCLKPKKEDIILSTYGFKKYYKNPNSLEPYEGIVLFKSKNKSNLQKKDLLEKNKEIDINNNNIELQKKMTNIEINAIMKAKESKDITKLTEKEIAQTTQIDIKKTNNIDDLIKEFDKNKNK